MSNSKPKKKKLKKAINHAGGKAMKCISCEHPLCIPGGFGGTDLCGPCCTGEAATLEEFGETW